MSSPTIPAELTTATASRAIELATGCEFEPELARAIDIAASSFCDSPALWAAFRALVDGAIAGDIPTSSVPLKGEQH